VVSLITEGALEQMDKLETHFRGKNDFFHATELQYWSNLLL
jgi:hypothetical protein